MANQSDRDGHNFNSNAAMQQQNTNTTRKPEAGKNKTNPNYKGDKNSDKSGKRGKDGCC
jgi:hypothetical protein